MVGKTAFIYDKRIESENNCAISQGTAKMCGGTFCPQRCTCDLGACRIGEQTDDRRAGTGQKCTVGMAGQHVVALLCQGALGENGCFKNIVHTGKYGIRVADGQCIDHRDIAVFGIMRQCIDAAVCPRCRTALAACRNNDMQGRERRQNRHLLTPVQSECRWVTEICKDTERDIRTEFCGNCQKGIGIKNIVRKTVECNQSCGSIGGTACKTACDGDILFNVHPHRKPSEIGVPEFIIFSRYAISSGLCSFTIVMSGLKE